MAASSGARRADSSAATLATSARAADAALGPASARWTLCCVARPLLGGTAPGLPAPSAEGSGGVRAPPGSCAMGRMVLACGLSPSRRARPESPEEAAAGTGAGAPPEGAGPCRAGEWEAAAVRRLATRLDGAAVLAGEVCPVCLDAPAEGERVVVPPCGHAGHAACLEACARHAPRGGAPLCPLCRAPLVDGVAPERPCRLVRQAAARWRRNADGSLQRVSGPLDGAFHLSSDAISNNTLIGR